MKKPLIFISGGIERYESGLFSGHHRVFAVANYSESILRAGGVPIIVPPTRDFAPADYVEELSEVADGLLLTGGNDIDPFLYGEEPHPKIGEFMVEKDRMEFALLNRAFALGVPIFGICRGLQILNVYLGGTLSGFCPPLSKRAAVTAAPRKAYLNSSGVNVTAISVINILLFGKRMRPSRPFMISLF
ncbi:MAG: gamma-glutamyl-gamma-aminobutyrate hydrolase family protein [Bacillota bacterium]|nr:gamma-glutamyl-gamma-aminobutyrate hydrolase family protein [Bacillota bacterium]